MTAVYDYKKFAVLFVDDEEQAQKYFRLALMADFKVLTASSAEQAWNLLTSGEHAVGVVITDQRMPQQTGTELLGRVRKSHPETVRILTTAFSDLDAAIEAVNDGAIFQYIVKPWDVRALRITLLRAMEYFLLGRERDLLLREKLSSFQQLLIADRVRALAILAEGLSPRVRNALRALEAYVALAKEELQPGSPLFVARMEEYRRQSRADADAANSRTLELVRGIAQVTLESRYEFPDTVDLTEAVDAAWSAVQKPPGQLPQGIASLQVQMPPGSAQVRGCREMLEGLFAGLLGQLVHAQPAAEHTEPRQESVQVTARQSPAGPANASLELTMVRSGLRWDGESTPQLFNPLWAFGDETRGSDLLAAFFVVHHHSGTLRLLRDQPGGAGFQLTLPLSPNPVAERPLSRDEITQFFFEMSRWNLLDRDA